MEALGATAAAVKTPHVCDDSPPTAVFQMTPSSSVSFEVAGEMCGLSPVATERPCPQRRLPPTREGCSPAEEASKRWSASPRRVKSCTTFTSPQQNIGFSFATIRRVRREAGHEALLPSRLPAERRCRLGLRPAPRQQKRGILFLMHLCKEGCTGAGRRG